MTKRAVFVIIAAAISWLLCFELLLLLPATPAIRFLLYLAAFSMLLHLAARWSIKRS